MCVRVSVSFRGVVVKKRGHRTYRVIVVLWIQLFLSQVLVSAAWCLQVSEAGSSSATAVLSIGVSSIREAGVVSALVVLRGWISA